MDSVKNSHTKDRPRFPNAKRREEYIGPGQTVSTKFSDMNRTITEQSSLNTDKTLVWDDPVAVDPVDYIESGRRSVTFTSLLIPFLEYK